MGASKNDSACFFLFEKLPHYRLLDCLCARVSCLKEQKNLDVYRDFLEENGLTAIAVRSSGNGCFSKHAL